MPRSSKWSPSCQFSNQNIICTFFSLMHNVSALLFPSYFIWTILGTMYKLWCSSSCTFLQSPVVSSPLASPRDFMLLVRSCHFVSDKRIFSMLFNDTVKCQDYAALDSVVRETLFIVDMFQCIEMGDVLKILCETWKKGLQNFESQGQRLTCCKLRLSIRITMEWQYMHWEKSQKN